MAIVFSAKIRGSGPEMQFSSSNYYTGELPPPPSLPPSLPSSSLPLFNSKLTQLGSFLIVHHRLLHLLGRSHRRSLQPVLWSVRRNHWSDRCPLGRGRPDVVREDLGGGDFRECFRTVSSPSFLFLLEYIERESADHRPSLWFRSFRFGLM